MKSIEVGLAERGYEIAVEAGSLEELGERVKEVFPGGKAALITDENVAELYGERALESMQGAEVETILRAVEPGEGSKDLEVAGELYDWLIEEGVGRDGTVLAFGGGVVGDLAGFVASTYLRGVNLIQIPTTLLAQVDSSVGGKTAVDRAGGKNLVGSFYQPSFVLVDPLVLGTLSAEDWRSGLGEVLKYGLIWDEELFFQVTEGMEEIRDLEEMELVEEIIARCCEIKAEVVARDERDRGLRMILNFGHTLGHGLEAAAGYGSMRHGEAVIWGMIGESWLSRRRGYLSSSEQERIEKFLLAVDPIPLPEMETDLLLEYVGKDKKVTGGKPRCVFLKGIGGETPVEEVEEEELRAGFRYLLELSQKEAGC